MKPINAAQLKQHLGAHLRAVQDGAEIVVSHRDRPIARLMPLQKAASDALVIIPPRRGFQGIPRKTSVKRRAGFASIDSLEVLRETRGDR